MFVNNSAYTVFADLQLFCYHSQRQPPIIRNHPSYSFDVVWNCACGRSDRTWLILDTFLSVCKAFKRLKHSNTHFLPTASTPYTCTTTPASDGFGYSCTRVDSGIPPRQRPSAHCDLVLNFLPQRKVTVLPHPPYSPDLMPEFFLLFPRLKLVLKGSRFTDVADIKQRVATVLREIPQEAFSDNFQQLYNR